MNPRRDYNACAKGEKGRFPPLESNPENESAMGVLTNCRYEQKSAIRQEYSLEN
jgi:hypothetical protein